MPFFSVIIPTYNRSGELQRSLDSVLDQIFPDLEVIVVDDGSTDDTASIVAAYTDPRIRYIHQENKERSAARNNGILHAVGKYICLLDSDDIYYPGHLQLLHDGIVRDNEPVAVYKTMMNYEDKSRPGDFSYAYKGNNRQEAIKYVWDNGSQLICLCFHKDIGENIHFPERFFWFEDVHWLIRVVMEYPLKQIMAHTTKYINKDTQHLLKSNYNKYLDNCEACIRNLEFQKGNELKEVIGKKCFDIKISELYLGFIVSGAIKTKQVKLGYTYLMKAIGTSITPKLFGKYCYYSLKLLRAVMPV